MGLIFSSGISADTRTDVSNPALAPYAATEAAMLPVETVPNLLNPLFMASRSVKYVPRSLNDHVGFTVSFLRRTLKPSSSGPSQDISGVLPSPSETEESYRKGGRKSEKSIRRQPVSSEILEPRLIKDRYSSGPPQTHLSKPELLSDSLPHSAQTNSVKTITPVVSSVQSDL